MSKPEERAAEVRKVTEHPIVKKVVAMLGAEITQITKEDKDNEIHKAGR